MEQVAIRCSVLRGGTSKGLYFRAMDLPTERSARDAVLLAAMGSPDPRQIDGMGGAHPLTSKVAVVGPSTRADADVDYLFLQVWPDRPEVADNQNCGNILAGVGPFAIEEGMVAAVDGTTPVRIWMANTQSLAVSHVSTPGGRVNYAGDARIDGVPNTHAPIPVEFVGTAGGTCGALLPTGHAVDVVEGVRVTCIDNGMPVACLLAADLGVTGHEDPVELEANQPLVDKVEAVRLAAGPLMHLGDVSGATVPKVSLLSPAIRGGVVQTRTFIPHRVHDSIGVFMAVSVATACLIPGSVAEELTVVGGKEGKVDLDVEHPTGFFTVTMDLSFDGGGVTVRRAALLRTARLLMRGEVLVPGSSWPAGAR